MSGVELRRGDMRDGGEARPVGGESRRAMNGNAKWVTVVIFVEAGNVSHGSGLVLPNVLVPVSDRDLGTLFPARAPLLADCFRRERGLANAGE